MKFKFPKGFLWGSATAAYQVEGGIESDWTQYMKDHSEELAKNSEVHYRDYVGMVGRFDQKIWDKFKTEASTPSNYVAGKAADHYNQYKKDLDLAKEMNHNSYRFSIEWARIEPEEGQFDENEIQHYVDKVKYMRSIGIEPVVTLLHFTQPVWVGKQDGWRNSKTVEDYVKYCKRIVPEFKGLVTKWVTINEPIVYTMTSYVSGEFPPGKTIGLRAIRVSNNLAKGHRQVYDFIKKVDPSAEVGIAKHLTNIKIHKSGFFLAPFIWIYDWLFNIMFTDKIKNHMDYIGINYYIRLDLTFKKILRGFLILVFGNKSQPVPDVKVKKDGVIGASDLGWFLYPKGLYNSVQRYWKRYKKPILITEHGLADADDRIRERYTRESLEYLHKAIQEGVDVRGYMHWSLLDNYEWDKGFWPRFGLIEVDFETQERRVRESAKWYAEVAKNNGF